MSKLFGCLRERYAARPGGFTRVLRIPNRKGDNAPMAIVELVDNRLVTYIKLSLKQKTRVLGYIACILSDFYTGVSMI